MPRRRADRPARAASLAEVVRDSFRMVTAAALLVVLTLTCTLSWVLFAAQPRIAELRSGVDAVRDSQQAMLDQETGARAYLLIGSPQFLQPYDSGTRALRVADARLDLLVRDEPSLASRLIAVRIAADRWQQQWGRPAVGERASLVAGSTASDPQRTAQFLARGKALFDAYRAAAARLQASVGALASSAVTEQDVVLAVTAVIELLIGLGAVALAVRRKRVLARDVVHPVDELLAHVDRVRHGDLASTVREGGPGELRRLGAGIGEMTTALAYELTQSQARRDELDAQAVKLRLVLALAREIAGSLSLRYILEAVAHAGTRITGYERATLWLMGEDQLLSPAYDSTLPRDTEPDGARLGLGEGLVGRAAKYGRAMTQQRHHAEGGALLTGPAAGEHVLAVPMIVGARVIGVVECHSAQPREIPEEDVAILETLAVHAATALEAARLHGRTEELASVDALTRLANRRRLDDDLATECERSVRYGRPLSFIMLDLDHFKRVNDTYGHQRADEVLQEVAGLLVEGLRTSDTAYRYGGEEIALLVRETGLAAAAQLAERLREHIERRFAHADEPTVTASFGVAQIPDHASTPSALIAAADAALYEAKRAGRNRVHRAQQLAIVPALP